jgi:WD40 repeat protein
MKFKRFLSGAAAIAALSATLAGPAKAGSVVSFDSLTGALFTGGGWSVGTESDFFTGGFSADAGEEFTATATGYIDSLTLALYGATSGTVIIYTANADDTLGTALETLNLSESKTANSFATGSYSSGTELQKGQNYWVLAVGPTDGTYQTWNEYNYATPDPLFSFQGVIGSCCTSVITTGIPIGPNSVDGFGMIVSIASAANAVPEPATWAMLIAGFGMVGAALRRKPGAFASA